MQSTLRKNWLLIALMNESNSSSMFLFYMHTFDACKCIFFFICGKVNISCTWIVDDGRRQMSAWKKLLSVIIKEKVLVFSTIHFPCPSKSY